MPTVPLEAMASAFPIDCVERRLVPRFLGDADVYSHLGQAHDVRDAIEAMTRDGPLHARLAESTFERPRATRWKRCAREALDPTAAKEGQRGARTPSTSVVDAARFHG